MLSPAASGAAFVTLARENDLPAVLESMGQLEDTFNYRYHYDWVFFSTEPLSDLFRSLTSNATAASCIYEVVLQHGGVDLHLDGTHLGPSNPTQTESGSLAQASSRFEESKHVLRQKYRWSCGPFAKEKRLQSYDWFWRIEPGAQFTQNIKFDVFRFMRDHNIAYGSSKASLSELRETALSRQVMGFLDKHSDLLHADADVSWVLDAIDAEDYSVVEQPPQGQARARHGTEMTCEADYETGALLTSWLASVYKSGPSPSFDVGALALFRSQSHQVLLDHLDETRNLYEGGLDDTLVPTISASMFLPQKSVWNFRRKDGRATRPRPPESTPEPRMRLWRRLKRASQDSRASHKRTRPSRYVQRNSMAEWLAIRDLMAQDLERQSKIPGLRSGNTVVDERNFSPS